MLQRPPVRHTMSASTQLTLSSRKIGSRLKKLAVHSSHRLHELRARIHYLSMNLFDFGQSVYQRLFKGSPQERNVVIDLRDILRINSTCGIKPKARSKPRTPRHQRTCELRTKPWEGV